MIERQDMARQARRTTPSIRVLSADADEGEVPADADDAVPAADEQEEIAPVDEVP